MDFRHNIRNNSFNLCHNYFPSNTKWIFILLSRLALQDYEVQILTVKKDDESYENGITSSYSLCIFNSTICITKELL